MLLHCYSKSNLSLYSLYCAEACNEFAGPISASLRPGNSALFEEMLQRWRVVGNTVSDLTGPKFEPQTYRSRNERVTARPTGRLLVAIVTVLAQNAFIESGFLVASIKKKVLKR